MCVTNLRCSADFLERTKQAHGSIVGLLLGGERVVLVSDPAAAKEVGRLWLQAQALSPIYNVC